jgi:hypothetical protein
MGYTTDFIGHVDIHPPLNEPEQAYLSAFAASRRYHRSGGPYDVPANPAAEHDERPTDIDRYNRVAPGQPSLWCGWVPCWDGCCLSHDGHEKFYAATEWMHYLIDHFLAPTAHARDSGVEYFRDFTFDHVLNGIIAGCRRDSHELYLIRVERNVVSEQILVPARFDDFGPLPYEIENDKNDMRRERRRRSS